MKAEGASRMDDTDSGMVAAGKQAALLLNLCRSLAKSATVSWVSPASEP